MSARSRHAKAEARCRARWADRRARLIAAQSDMDMPPFSEVAIALAFDLDPARLGFFCDGEAAARRWCAHHPRPLPDGLGAAYRAKRRGSW